MREILKGRCYSKYHFNIRQEYITKYNLNENSVILYRIVNTKTIAISRIIKIHRKSDNEIRYVLPQKMKVLKENKIKLPCNLDIEILKRKPKGFKPSVKKYNNKIDLISFLRDNKSITCIPLGKKIFIYKEGKRSSSFISMPRFISSDKFLMWNMGFYLAEGLKKNNNRVAVSNSEWYLIREFQIFLKNYFGLSDRSFFVYLRIDDERKRDNAANYWSKKLKLKKSQIRVSKPNIRPPKSKFGNCEIVIYNTSFSYIFMDLFNFIIRLNMNKEDSISFIRGVEAGDGYVTDNGGIEIGIVTDKIFSHMVLEKFRNICHEARIRNHHTSKNARIIFCKGRKNATLCLLDGHFNEHKRRRKRLVELLRYYLRNDLRYMRLINNTSIKQLSKDVGVTYKAANIITRRLECEGKIKNYIVRFTGINKQNYEKRIFNLTERGKDILKYLSVN